MKKRAIFVILATTVCALFTVNNPTFAQGSAFQYQGHLNDSGNPANGNYDVTFTLFATNSGGMAIAGPLTNFATAVSNGLFSVVLDFGAGVFTGSNYWLEINVRTNGGSGFVTLAPRQALLPVPYAIMASSASNLLGTLPAAQLSGALPATQLSGTVPIARLPVAVVTNGAAGVSLSGTFSGNGSGLTNVMGAPLLWQIVPGTNQTAAANQTYWLTNNALDTLTLPVSPNPGDTITIIGAGTNGWQVIPGPGQTIVGQVIAPVGTFWTQQTGQAYQAYWTSIASSADGSHIVAVANNQYGTGQGGGIYTSSNFGTNWTEQFGAPTSPGWYGVASSADGSHLAAALVDGGIYTSSDFGTNWTQQIGAPSSGYWYSVASSADGSHLAAVVMGGGLYTSSNFGTNWLGQNAPLGAEPWTSVASSADGGHLVAAAFGNGGLSFSSNFGTNWTESMASQIWQSVALSTNAGLVAAGGYGGGIYISSNFGSDWTQGSGLPSTNWSSVAMSGDGSRLVAADGYGIWTSTNSGNTWQAQNAAPMVSFVASSADGECLVAAGSESGIYTSVPTKLPYAGVPGEIAQFQYLGNGVWQPLIQLPAPTAGNYLHSYSTVTQPVVTVDAFQFITNNVDAQISGWAHTPGSGFYTNAQTGLYLVQYTAEVITTATTATTVSLIAEVNGTEVPDSQSTAVANTANQTVAISKSFIASFNSGNVLQFEFAGSNKDDRLVSGFGIGGTRPSFSCTVVRIQ